MLSEVLVHLEHAHLVLAAEDGPELFIRQDFPLVLGVLQMLALMYSHTLLTTSVRGRGDDPTTAASSFDGCTGFARAGFGFLSAILIFLCCAGPPSAGATWRDQWRARAYRALNPSI
jgi:hypothetical protein